MAQVGAAQGFGMLGWHLHASDTRDLNLTGNFASATQSAPPPMRPARPGFAMAELVATLAILGVVFAMLSVMLPRQRQLAQLGESLANLKEFGTLTGMYAADNDDRYWALSWKGDGVTQYPSPYLDLRGPFTDDMQAQAAQAVDLLRRVAGREDMPVVPNGWLAPLRYSHLVLADYAGLELPMRIAISPADERRQCWSSDPAAFDRGECQPQPDPTAVNKRWPYSTSYELGINFFSPDFASGVIVQAGQHNFYTWTGRVSLGGRRQREVTYPSHKAMMWDEFQRHFGDRQPYFMVAEARYPVLFADGAVRVRSGADANRGWDPANPRAHPSGPGDNNGITSVIYSPANWEPALPQGVSASMSGARQRFTRAGLGGRDFDADEVRTD
jgi:hypothetical protein